MHRTLIPLAALATLGFVGGAVAQDAAQAGPDSGSDDVEALTCADLNEMEPAVGVSFLRGYQYGLTAASRAGGTDSTAAASGDAAATGPGSATTTGDVQSGSLTSGESAAAVGGTADGTPFDAEAILASCFDMPGRPLDEILGGAFGVLD